MKRPSWKEYFMQITENVATRSTCLRREVGAVIVRDNRILTTGYNGAPTGLDHCQEVGCLRDKLNIPSGEKQELCRGIHAEQNALIQAAKYGISLENSEIFVTTQPCITCTKLLINAGIKKVIYKNPYPDKYSLKLLEESDTEVEIYE